MAKDKNENGQQTPVDNATLLENIRGLETEKELLKTKVQNLENQKEEILKEHEQSIAVHKEETEENNKTIESLRSEVDTLKAELEEKTKENSQKVSENESEAIQKLVCERDEALNKAAQTSKDLQNKQEQIQKLTEELNACKNETKGIVLQPFIAKYVERLASKLSQKYKKEISVSKIIEDYIIRYNLTEHWTQWFHPWVMTDQDAVEIAQQINPAIKNINDLKQALNIN